MKNPSPFDIRLSISQAIYEYNQKLHRQFEAGKIDRLQWQRSLFPIHAKEIIQGAITKACNEKGKYK